MFGTKARLNVVAVPAALALLAAGLLWPLAATAQTINNTASVAPPSGIDDPNLGDNQDSASVQRLLPAITLDKSGIGPSPLVAGSLITYSFLVTNTGDTPLASVTVSDPLPGLSVISCPATNLAVGASTTCTASYTITQADVDAGFVANTATVTAAAPGGVSVQAQDSAVLPPTQAPGIALVKNGTDAGPAPLLLGDTVNYTFTVTNTGSVTLTGVTVTDPLPGLTAPSCPLTTLTPAQSTVCTATYTVTQVDVDAGRISNSASATGTPPGGQPPPVAQDSFVLPTARNPAIALTKTGGGIGPGPLPNPLVAGATVEYEFLVSNSGNVSLSNLRVSDPLPGLSAVGCPATTLAVGAGMVCTATYVVTAADVEAGQITNTATAAGTPPDGLPDVTAQDTETLFTTQQPAIALVKSGTPVHPVSVGSTVNYSFEVTNSGNVTLTNVTLTDPLPGLSAVTCPFGELFPAQVMVCTASYGVTQADRDAGEIRNTATVSAQPAVGAALSAQDDVTIALPTVSWSKAANTAGPVPVGGTIGYTLSATVANGPLGTPLELTDTLGTGLALGTVTAGAPFACNAASPLLCTLPAGTAAGTYAVNYTAAVTVEAGSAVNNRLTSSQGRCVGSCTTSTPVSDELLLRLSKAAQPREVRIGDFVRYTVTIENLGDNPIEGFTLVDTPPPGFGFVENSLTVDDRDDAGVLAGTQPLRVERLDVEVGGRVTVGYLLRVGAGVRHGEYVNTAIARYGARTLSNQGTARVRLIADPLTEESLLLGTVFDDRDGDGWQDSAALSGVSVRGGFAPGAYVARSTTLDRGDGPRPLADASAPLLHGLSLGDIAGRQSEADAGRRVVISQLLSSPEFTGDFVLQSAQGHRLRMDAAGRTRLDTEGEAAGGRSAAMPTVQRRLARVEGGYRVDYVIGNAGIDERGIPGVRIASVEGLLVETDAFGRYHLAGIDGGRWERGRNLVLKVDPVTLPPGARFTTRNPLLRRVTPGLPVRMDFGVQLPPDRIGGGMGEVEMELGEVLFDAGSARLREPYRPVVERMAARVREHGGGEVVIAADGETQALAYDRARAVREALLEQLPAELARALSVSLRADAADPSTRLLTLGDAVLLGTVLFDTDRARIQPAFEPVIAKIAADLEARGGGVVAVIGHADRRGSEAHNDALGLRRAKAVYEAIAARLGPEARARLKVEISEDPRAPTGLRGRRGGATE